MSVHPLPLLFFILGSFNPYQKYSKMLPLPINSNWSNCPPLPETAFCLPFSWQPAFGVHSYDPQLHSSPHLCSFLRSLGSWHTGQVPGALPAPAKPTCTSSCFVTSPLEHIPSLEIVTPSTFNFNFAKYYILHSYFKTLKSWAVEKGSDYRKPWRCTTPGEQQELWLPTTLGNHARNVLLLLRYVFHSLKSEIPHRIPLDIKHQPWKTTHWRGAWEGGHGVTWRCACAFAVSSPREYVPLAVSTVPNGDTDNAGATRTAREHRYTTSRAHPPGHGKKSVIADRLTG